MFCLKNEQECIIRFKNSRRRGEFLHLIIQDCEFFQTASKIEISDFDQAIWNSCTKI